MTVKLKAGAPMSDASSTLRATFPGKAGVMIWQGHSDTFTSDNETTVDTVQFEARTSPERLMLFMVSD